MFTKQYIFNVFSEMFLNDDSETRTLPGPSGPEIINFVMKQKQHIYIKQ